MGLDIKNFNIYANGCAFTGSAKLKNFEDPNYEIYSKIKLNLGDIKKLIPDSLVNHLSGEIRADFISAGEINLDSISDQINSLIFEKSSFKLGFDNVSFEMPDTLISINNFSGQLNMQADTIAINNMSGEYSGIEFKLDSTNIVNMYNSVIKNQPERLYVEGIFKLGDIDYSMFAPFIPSDTLEVETNTTTLVKENIEKNTELQASATNPETNPDTKPRNFNYQLKGKLFINSFTYDKVFVENISGLFNVTDSLYIIDQLMFNAFDGEMNTSAKYALNSNGETVIKVKNHIEGMDIKKLLIDFEDFKNFGQPIITHQNITGLISADLNSRFVLINGSLIKEDMRAKGDIKLENGGVYDFEPAMELAKFTKINELDNIKFKTLESQIFIFKNAIYVPKTQIVSTALDISAFGMKKFGEDYEYHLQIHLGEILLGKSKKLLKEQSEMGDIAKEDNRSSIFIVSSSFDGKSKNGFDNKKMKKKMEVKIKVQEKMLDLIFHPKLVSFSTGVCAE